MKLKKVKAKRVRPFGFFFMLKKQQQKIPQIMRTGGLKKIIKMKIKIRFKTKKNKF